MRKLRGWPGLDALREYKHSGGLACGHAHERKRWGGLACGLAHGHKHCGGLACGHACEHEHGGGLACGHAHGHDHRGGLAFGHAHECRCGNDRTSVNYGPRTITQQCGSSFAANGVHTWRIWDETHAWWVTRGRSQALPHRLHNDTIWYFHSKQPRGQKGRRAGIRGELLSVLQSYLCHMPQPLRT